MMKAIRMAMVMISAICFTLTASVGYSSELTDMAHSKRPIKVFLGEFTNASDQAHIAPDQLKKEVEKALINRKSVSFAIARSAQDSDVQISSVINGYKYMEKDPIKPSLSFIMAISWYENLLVNDFALMAIMIWMQAGFAMVLLSAAIKGVPMDTIEAARIDGATEFQIFFKVVIPQIASTLVVVLTTILILVLKIFDIVRVTTNGRGNTQVIANYFYTFFEGGNYGRAGVVVILLVLMTFPFMILNVKRFREQEAQR